MKLTAWLIVLLFGQRVDLQSGVFTAAARVFPLIFTKHFTVTVSTPYRKTAGSREKKNDQRSSLVTLKSRKRER